MFPSTLKVIFLLLFWMDTPPVELSVVLNTLLPAHFLRWHATLSLDVNFEVRNGLAVWYQPLHSCFTISGSFTSCLATT